MKSDVALLRDAAVEAGDIAVKIRKKGLKIRNKAGGSPVTNGDIEANEVLKAILQRARPDYGWQSEEDKDDPDERLERSHVFVIDPIDGTSSYMQGREYWSVSIAVVANGRPTAGVVYAPSLDQIYEAAAGHGAYLNTKRIHASACASEDGCSMLGTTSMFEHPSWPTPWPKMHVEQRNSIAYRMALVASGEFDACLAPSRKHDWDLAAGDLIVHEAGGLATDHLGRTFRYNTPTVTQPSLVCAGPSLHPRLIARLSHIDLKS